MPNDISYYFIHLVFWIVFFLFKLYRYSFWRWFYDWEISDVTTKEEITIIKIIGALAIIGHTIAIAISLL